MTTAAARLLPRLPLGGGRSWLLVNRNFVAARRYWLVFTSGFFEPLLYLLGIGVGVGTLVGKVEFHGHGVSYEAFVAPALLAVSAMNGAVYESTINVFFKLKYAKTYDSVLSTPLEARDVALGEIAWALIRGTVYALAFVLVMLALGLVHSPWALLALPASLLVGFAFAAVGFAAVTLMRSWADMALVDAVVLPLFLLSATFAPVSAYPGAARYVLPATPLYHGVELLRELTLGAVGLGTCAHVAYLAAMGLAGLAVAGRRLERLLLP